MCQELSKGALQSILSGQVVKDVKMQILGIKTLMAANNTNRYRLLVSDGEFMYSFVMLSKYLAPLVISNQLSDYAIVVIRKYITTKLDTVSGKTRLTLVILDLEVLVKGNEVKNKIKKAISLDNDDSVPKLCNTDFESEDKSLIKSQESVELSEGAIEIILNGKNFQNAHVQILGIRKVTSLKNVQRYRLLISDGKNKYSFVFLPPELAHLVDSGQLPIFTIICIKKFVLSSINTSAGKRYLIVFLDVVIVKNGDDVNVEIGNPIKFDKHST